MSTLENNSSLMRTIFYHDAIIIHERINISFDSRKEGKTREKSSEFELKCNNFSATENVE
jgi:hypothetical protein